MNTLANKFNIFNRDGSMYDILQMKSVDYYRINAMVDAYRNDSIRILKGMLER